MLQTVSLRVQSRILGVRQLSALLGVAPSSSAEAGDPVSTHRMDGPRHEVTTWTRSSMIGGEALGEHLAALKLAIDRLGRVREEDPDIVADLMLMLEAAPLGAMVNFDVEHLGLLASAGCGVVVDAYETDVESA